MAETQLRDKKESSDRATFASKAFAAQSASSRLGPFTIGSAIGGIRETQEMLNFCGEKGITSDIELIRIQQINEAYERLLKSDVKYRSVIDAASLRT